MSVLLGLFSTVAIIAGIVFFVAGTVGLLRFPDALTRLHALTKADNLGLGLIVLGLLPYAGSVGAALKLVVIWALVQFAGATVALMDIRAPMMVVATTRDHVSPWKSVYKIHQQTDTQITFVLAEGGHNAGIVSEPGRPRRSYQMGCAEDSMGGRIDPDDWKAAAPVTQGSWWEAMHAWLAERSGRPGKSPAFKREQVLCDAPGEYVMVRYAD